MITMEELKTAAEVAGEKTADLPDELRGFMMHIHLTGAMNNQGPEDWAYRNYHDLVAQLATPRTNPLVLPKGWEPMEQGQCFYNAWELVCGDPTLIYCEGFASAGIFPTEHAWVETPDGEIIDPTWAELEHASEAQYLGIRFSAEFAMRHSVRTGWSSILHSDDAEADHEILRFGLKMHNGIAIDISKDAS